MQFVFEIKIVSIIHVFTENKPKKELIGMLQEMGYDSDPVKAWKEAQEKVRELTAGLMGMPKNQFPRERR